MGRLKGFDQIDESRVYSDHLQHADLVDDIRPTILPFPPLPQELCGILLAVLLAATSLDHCKLTPAKGGNYTY